MLTKDPREAVEDLAALIQYARELGGLEDESPEFQRLAAIVIQAEKDNTPVDMKTLVDLTHLAQDCIKLGNLQPTLPIRLAAAWHGLSYHAVRDAVYAKRVDAVKPAHDWLIPAAEVQNYKPRYPLRRWMETVSSP